MPNYTWELRNKQDKPNSNQSTTAELWLIRDGQDANFCYVETWLYGCCLSGLSKLDNLNYLPAEAFPSLRKFLSTLTCKMNQPDKMYNNYISKRFMFTTTTGSSKFGLKEELIKNSVLITSFENWCHNSSENQMYFLNLKD